MNTCRRLFVLLWVGFLAADPVWAGTATNRPFLWRIEAAGAKPSFVFGSIHIPHPATTNLPPAVAKALAEADAVYCELPFDEQTMREAALTAMAAERPLAEVLPTNLYARAEAEMRRILPALGIRPLERAEVWTLAFQLMVLEDQMKYPAIPPLDLLFYQRARAAGKEVGGLETLQEQLEAMRSFTHGEQVDLLRATLDDIADARQRGTSPTEELLAVYLAGDSAALDREADRVLSTYSPALRQRFEQTLLGGRNRVMADRIVKKLNAAPGRSHVFVLGALHSIGQGSVVERLAAAGLKVERVAP